MPLNLLLLSCALKDFEDCELVTEQISPVDIWDTPIWYKHVFCIVYLGNNHRECKMVRRWQTDYYAQMWSPMVDGSWALEAHQRQLLVRDAASACPWSQTLTCHSETEVIHEQQEYDPLFSGRSFFNSCYSRIWCNFWPTFEIDLLRTSFICIVLHAAGAGTSHCFGWRRKNMCPKGWHLGRGGTDLRRGIITIISKREQ